MRKNDLTIRYAVIQFTFWVCFAGIVAFSSYYLLSRGLNNTQIGLIIAVGGLLAALLQPAAGILMDRFPRLTSPLLLAGVFLLVTLDALALILFRAAGVLLTGVLYGLLVLAVQLCQSVLNVIGVDSMSNGNQLRFNVARGAGSLGYAAAAWGIGWLTGLFSPSVVLVVVGIAALVMIVTAWCYPLQKGGARSEVEQKKDALGPIAFLIRYPMFALLLPALVLIYISHAILNTFTLQIVSAFGAGSAEMGASTAIAAAFELVTVLGFSWFRSRFRIQTLLRVSGLFFLIKALISALANSIQMFLLAQACQIFAWGIMCIGLVFYVNELIPGSDRAKGQTYAGMTLTVANVISGVVGGRIIDGNGIHTLLLLGVAACACGCVLLFAATRSIGHAAQRG